MEKKTIRSGAPFLIAGVCVMAVALIFGIGGLGGCLIAAAAGFLGFAVGKKMFPDQVIEVEIGPESGNADVDALILEVREQLDRISLANDVIADAALSEKIADIERTGRQMLLRLEEQPGMLSSMRTFLRYYLPATLKLLDARAKIEKEVAAGQSTQIAAKIDEAVTSVQGAFRKQLEALNEYRFINLESEMDVLADMLRADGLADEDEADAAEAKSDEEDLFAGLFTRGGK